MIPIIETEKEILNKNREKKKKHIASFVTVLITA